MATFVLVHGTMAGGWAWKQVAAPLEAAGHAVYRPTLTGLGERAHLLTRETGLQTHIQDIASMLVYEDLSDVILAGHSYAGMVITGVADLMPERVRELVYLDAMAPQDGENMLDLSGPVVAAIAEERVRSQGDGWLIPALRDPADPHDMNVPHPWKTWTDRITLRNPGLAAIPRTYVRFAADKQPGAFFEMAMAISWARAQAGGWRLREIPTVHQIPPDPEPKAAVLLDLFPV